MVKLSDVSDLAFRHFDRDNDFLCQRSYVSFKIWMLSGLAISTAAYNLFCVFLVTRLIGRDRFQDDPFFLGNAVFPGRMPIGTLGITTSIAFLGSGMSQLLVVPLADRYGRKLLFEICLLVMFISSSLSAFSFYKVQSDASGPNVIGSLCFWRLFVGLGVGGMVPLAATMMAEHAPKRIRGTYLALVCSFQGFGVLVAALVTMASSTGIITNYPGTPFPQQVPGCATFTELDTNGIDPTGGYLRLLPCPITNQNLYAQQVKQSTPSQVEFIWRSVLSAGGCGALITLLLSRCFLIESPRFTAHVLGKHMQAVHDLAVQVAHHTHPSSNTLPQSIYHLEKPFNMPSNTLTKVPSSDTSYTLEPS